MCFFVINIGYNQKNLYICREFLQNITFMAHRIKELIREKGYTQQDFANKLGIARESLARILNSPSYPSLMKIAEALEVEEWELFTDKRLSNDDEGMIVCPKCGTKFKMQDED